MPVKIEVENVDEESTTYDYVDTSYSLEPDFASTADTCPTYTEFFECQSQEESYQKLFHSLDWKIKIELNITVDPHHTLISTRIKTK